MEYQVEIKMKKYVFYGITCFIGVIFNFLGLLSVAGSHSAVSHDINTCIFNPLWWMGYLWGLWGRYSYFAYGFTLYGLWIGLFIIGVILLRKKVSPYILFLVLPVLSLTSYIVSLCYGSPFGRL
jgi:hypothetical protein